MAGLVLLALAGAQPAGAATVNSYKVKVLVADQGKAPHVDANLVDPWGLAASGSSPWWVANAGTGTSTIYTSDGTPSALVVGVQTSPTGIVYNAGSGFPLPDPALFIYSTLEGTIRAWAPALGTTSAIVAFGSGGAAYTGIAIDFATTQGDCLLAADFGAGTVDVFDSDFHSDRLPGGFVDPNLPAGYTPFGIADIQGTIFVTYALKSGSGLDAPGAGHGVIDAFDTEGQFVARVASGGPLNSPWSVVKAPKSFGQFGGDLLVGNTGNGRINAYRWTGSAYKHAGALRLADGSPLTIAGLHGLAFGNGANAGPKSRLYFTAAPSMGAHGRMGVIRAG